MPLAGLGFCGTGNSCFARSASLSQSISTMFFSVYAQRSLTRRLPVSVAVAQSYWLGAWRREAR